MSDAEILELTELCNGLVDTQLNAGERKRLNEILARSEEARCFYVRFSGLSSSLCSYASELQFERVDSAIPTSRIIPFRRIAWSAGALAAAAAIVVALTMAWRSSDSSEILTGAPESVAWLTGVRDAVWKDDSLATGDAIERGQRLDLQRGVAEVTFDSGARVVLEGPASIDVQSAWAAGLRSGAVTATAPTEAAGFRVVNDAVDVTNLGGEVDVIANAGSAEVYPIDGNIEAARPDRGETLQLNDRQARRFARDGISRVDDRNRKLARMALRTNFDRRGRPLKFARWSFDSTNGNSLLAETNGFAGGDLEAKFENPSGAIAEKLLAPGRWRKALALDGNHFAAAKIPGTNPRTIAFWVKVPPNASATEDSAILGWIRKGKGAARTAQITWNRDPERAPLGALCTEHDTNTILGRTSLRDGQWHHVAVLFVGGKKAPGMVQVKQFVDGRLDGSGPMALRRKNMLSSGEGNELFWIGRRAGKSAVVHDGFHGDLDELFMADRPLAPFEIRQLMENNQPPGV